jgi:uncharacterized coiled-coil DUF342 family protein
VAGIETRDLVSLLAVIVSIVSMIIVSRSARRATSVNAQNLDLVRIRDLRAELSETRNEMDKCRSEVRSLTVQLEEANQAALKAYREREDMRRYAQMPGMDIETWLRRFLPPQQLSGTIDS